MCINSASTFLDADIILKWFFFFPPSRSLSKCAFRFCRRRCRLLSRKYSSSGKTQKRIRILKPTGDPTNLKYTVHLILYQNKLIFLRQMILSNLVSFHLGFTLPSSFGRAPLYCANRRNYVLSQNINIENLPLNRASAIEVILGEKKSSGGWIQTDLPPIRKCCVRVLV